MGLAERFKEKMEKGDIFQKSEKTKYATKETDKKELPQITNLLKQDLAQTKQVNYPETKFEELETEIIGKIRKTPYWADYSTTKQENMISKYFDNKVQKNKYSKIEYSASDKLNFIQNIITLANCK